MTSGYQAFSRPAGGKAADCRTIPALHAKLRSAADPLLGEEDSGWHAPMHLAEGMASFPVRMPSLRIRCCRVPRGMPSCAAAPFGPDILPPVQASAFSIRRHSFSARVGSASSVAARCGIFELPACAMGLCSRDKGLCRRKVSRTKFSVTAPCRECRRIRVTTFRNSRILPGQEIGRAHV